MPTVTTYNEAIATQLSALISKINKLALNKAKHHNDINWWSVLESYKETAEFSLTDLIALSYVSNYIYNNCSDSMEKSAKAFCRLIDNALKNDHNTVL